MPTLLVSLPAVACDEPAEVANAEMEGRQEQPYTYRSVVRYHCRVGTLTGEREIWCTEAGTWSAPPPTCKGPSDTALLIKK